MMSYDVIHAPHRGGDDEGLTRPWQGVRVCEGQPHGRGGDQGGSQHVKLLLSMASHCQGVMILDMRN